MLGIGLLFMAGILAASLVGLGEADEDDDSMDRDLSEDGAGPHEDDSIEVPETEEGASGGSWLQSIVGTDEDDILPDGPGDDAIAGEGGNDLISGYANAYFVVGGTYIFEDLRSDGMDTFHGGEGNDTIGLSNGDQAYGGAGRDTFVVYHDSSVAEPPTIHDFAPAAGDDIRIVVDAADPSHDMFISDYVGQGEFEYSGDVQTRILEATNRTAVLLNGLHVAYVDGIHEDLADRVTVRGFLL